MKRKEDTYQMWERTIATELKKKYELLTPIKKTIQMPVVTSDLIEENHVV